jgi:hypothetical protein
MCFFPFATPANIWRRLPLPPSFSRFSPREYRAMLIIISTGSLMLSDHTLSDRERRLPGGPGPLCDLSARKRNPQYPTICWYRLSVNNRRSRNYRRGRNILVRRGATHEGNFKHLHKEEIMDTMIPVDKKEIDGIVHHIELLTKMVEQSNKEITKLKRRISKFRKNREQTG